MIEYLSLRPYPANVAFSFQEKAFRREMKRLCGDDVDANKTEVSDATLHMLCDPKLDPPLTCILHMRPDVLKKRNNIEIAGLCAHEAVHVWQKVKSIIGEDEPGLEQEAYFIQYVMQFFMVNALNLKKKR